MAAPEIHSAPGAPDRGVIDAWKLIHFFHEHATLLTLSLLLGATVAVFYLWSVPAVFSSRAILEVALTDPTLSDLQHDPEATADLSSASLLKTVEQTVGDDAVLNRVLAADDLARDPSFVPAGTSCSPTQLLERFRRRVAVGLIRGTRLIAVSVHASDPWQAQRLAQSIIDQYFALNFQGRRDDADTARTLLAAEANRIGAKVSDSEHRLEQYREKYNALGLADRQELVVDRIRHLHEQVSDALSNRLALEAVEGQVTTALASPRPVDALLDLSGVANRQEVIDLRKQLDEESTQIAPLALRYGENHPVMVQARLQVQETRAALDKTVRAAASGLLHSYQAAKSTEQALRRDLATQEKAAIDLDRDAINYHALEREVQANTAVYQQILARLKETDVTQNLMAGGKFSGGYVRVIQKPLVSTDQVWPKWQFVLPGGLLLGGILGGLAALARRALDNTLSSVDEAEACLGAGIVAVVPRSRQLGFRRGGRVAFPAPGAPDAEAFRSLRTTLALCAGGEGQRATMFTSAVPGEGKSYCASNFAAIVAQSGQRTLLIDGDLRRPVLRHGFHKRRVRSSLMDCLKDPAAFELAIEPTPVPRLFLLGNSVGTPLSSEWLASDNLRVVIGKALAQFDRVVIDTAPVAVVSDALYFARLAPTICFVVHAGRTPKRVSQRACMRLRAVTGGAFVGVILNQIRGGEASSYHYYYYPVKHYAPGLATLPAAG